MFKAIFDNGGGIIVVVDRKWAHYYDGPTQAASDYAEYKKNGLGDWDGHEPELLNIGNTACCLVMYEDDIEAAVKSYISNPDSYISYGHNEYAFIAYLANENV